MSARKVCCVPECADRQSVRHRLPTDKRISSIWQKRVNNQKVLAITDPRQLSEHRVCHRHFHEMCHEGNKLKRYSLPTLNLPDYHDAPTKETCFRLPSPVNAGRITPNTLRDALKKASCYVPPVGAIRVLPEWKVKTPQKVYGKKILEAPYGSTLVGMKRRRRLFNEAPVKKHPRLQSPLSQAQQSSATPAKTSSTSTSTIDSLLADASIDLPATQESTHQLTIDFAKDVSCSYEELSSKSNIFGNCPNSSGSETLTFLPSTIEAGDERELDDIQNPEFGTPLETSEDETPAFEKPYFTALKSYLKDQRCFTDVCRICFRSIVDENVVLLLNNSSTSDEFRTKLKVILPDLDLDIYQNSTFCRKCMQVVENSYELRQKWLSTEEKLVKIIEKRKNDRNSNADLVIMLKPTVDDEMIDIGENTNTHSGIVKSGDDRNHNKAMKQPHSTEKLWGSGPYICDFCADVFTELRLFKIHLEKHNETDQNQQTICEICGEFFTNGSEYRVHFVKHAKLRSECRVCKKRFQNRRRLNMHIKRYHKKKLQLCKRNADGKKLLNTNAANTRRKKLHSRKYYLCHLCNKQFLFTWYLEQHLRVHYDKLECEHCGKFIKFGNSSQILQKSRSICL